jgi:hypothetical protein
VAGAFAGDRLAVELAAEADGELADVDHLLDFAERFLRNLAGFPADERGEIGFVFAELLAEGADELAAHGGGDCSPCEERVGRGVDSRFHVAGACHGHGAEGGAVNRRADGNALARRGVRGDAEAVEGLREGRVHAAPSAGSVDCSAVERTTPTVVAPLLNRVDMCDS